MVRTCAAHEYGLHSQESVHLEARLWKAQTWPTKDVMEGVITKDINKLECRWSVEEAEIAAKNRSMWKHLSRQAAGAVNIQC